MDFLSWYQSRIMRLSGVSGRRVFIQDSDRPATDIMSAYTIHRMEL
jgi:hypothetical protein